MADGMSDDGWAAAEAWLRERHAPDDLIHACRVTGTVRDPVHPFQPDDDREEERAFNRIRENYVLRQPAAKAIELTRDGFYLNLYGLLDAYRSLLAIDAADLDYLTAERHRQMTADARETLATLWRSRHVPGDVRTYWEAEFVNALHDMAAPPDDRGAAVELSAEDMEFIRRLEQDFGDAPE